MVSQIPHHCSGNYFHLLTLMFEIPHWKPLCLLLADVTAVYHANPGCPVMAEPRAGAVPLLYGRGAATPAIQGHRV